MRSPEDLNLPFERPGTRAINVDKTTQASDSSFRVDTETLVSQIRKIPRHGATFRNFVELRLQRTGLLSVLEQAGVVPPLPRGSNPLEDDDGFEPRLYRFQEQPDVVNIFRKVLDERNSILDLIYVGVEIDQIVGSEWRFIETEEEYLHVLATREPLISFLQQEYRNLPGRNIEQEMKNNFGELVSVLEETGIIPLATLPPDWSKWDQEQRMFWLGEDPNLEERARTLSYLKIGKLLNPIIHELSFRSEPWIPGALHSDEM